MKLFVLLTLSYFMKFFVQGVPNFKTILDTLEQNVKNQKRIVPKRSFNQLHPECMKDWIKKEIPQIKSYFKTLLSLSDVTASPKECTSQKPLIVTGNAKTMPPWLPHFPHYGETVVRFYSIGIWLNELYPRSNCINHSYLMMPANISDDMWGYIASSGRGLWIPEITQILNEVFDRNIFISDTYPVDYIHQKPERLAILTDYDVLNFIHPSDALLLTSNILQKEPCQYYNKYNEMIKKKVNLLVLDRRQGRSILNIKEVTSHLLDVSLQNNDFSVHVEKFEHTSFMEQVEILSNTDIFIGIHGAAFVDLYFMKPCSAVIVINPWLFHNWGTLMRFSSSAGILYYEWMETNEATIRNPHEEKHDPGCHQTMKHFLDEWNSPERGPKYHELFDQDNHYTSEALPMKCAMDYCSVCARQIVGVYASLQKLEHLVKKALTDRQECMKTHPFYNPYMNK